MSNGNMRVQPMTRLLANNSWYDALAPGSLYEDSYQNILLEKSSQLFPHYICIQYDRLLSSPEGKVKPDLALIDKSYRHWVVIEVELLTHSLARHVRPQMLKLTSARYGSADGEWICDHHPNVFLRERLCDLTDSVYPTVLLIANGHDQSWHDELKDISMEIMVIELFRNRLDDVLLSISGSLPSLDSASVTNLLPAGGFMKGWFKVENPGAIVEREDDSVELLGPEYGIRGVLKRIGGSLYFVPAGEWPWDNVDSAYLLREHQAGKYRVEPIGEI